MEILDELASNKAIIGYDLVCKFRAGAPIFKVSAKADVLESRKLPTVAEFVLRLVQTGVRDERELAQTLGLDLVYVRSALTHLNINQFIVRVPGSEGVNSSFTITPKGGSVLDEAVVALYPDFFDFHADGIGGGFTATRVRSLLDHNDLKKEGYNRFLPVTDEARPSIKSLNASLADLRPIYESAQDNCELVEIVEVVDLYLAYTLVNVLAYRNRTNGRISIRVFDGYEERTDYNEVLTKRERELGGIIPPDMLIVAGQDGRSDLSDIVAEGVEKSIRLSEAIAEIDEEKKALQDDETQPDPTVVTAKSRRIQELESEVAELKGSVGETKPVQDQEHRFYLKQVFEQAKYNILIVSPWIKSGATDGEIIRLMRKSVARGVKIAILYGMPLRDGETESDYIDGKVEKEFLKIQQSSGKGALHYEFSEDGTHAKVAMCDEKFCVVTSFNWLSYRGDRGFRLELGSFSKDKHFIKELRNTVIKQFARLPQGFWKE